MNNLRFRVCATVLVASVHLSAASVATAKPLAEPVRVTQVEVTYARDLEKHDLTGAIRQAVLDEQSWYAAATGKPVVMVVAVDKVAFRSVGGAVLENIPLVGLFAPTNENRVRATVRLREPNTGAILAEYKKVDSLNEMGLSAADIGSTALSFIPIVGDIASAATDVARAGANKRDAAAGKMSRHFAADAFSEMYGPRRYTAAKARKKAAAKAAKAAGRPVPLTPPAPIPAAVPVAEAARPVEPSARTP